MILANKEAVTTVIDILNFFLNSLQKNNPIVFPLYKLIAKIDEQI